MSLVTVQATDCLSAEQAEVEAQGAWEREMEVTLQGRGRTRSRSFLANDEPDADASSDRRRRSRAFKRDVEASDDDAATRSRSRSRSFSALQQPQPLAQDAETAAKRAASLSKMYLAGSAPVDVSKLQSESNLGGVKKVEVVHPTGALSAAALDALSEGLQLSVDNSPMPSVSGYGEEELTEEELEEKKMEEEEDQKLQVEKLTSRRSLTMRASLFRTKMFKSTSRLLGNSEEGVEGEAVKQMGQKARTTGTGTDKVMLDVAVEATPVPLKKKHKLKLLLLGDSGVGKTSLMRVFSGDEFSESMLATAG